VVAELRRSRRYGSLADATLRRVAEDAVRVERGRLQAAAKRSKRELHEIYGAYVGPPPPYARLERELRAAVATGDPEPPLRNALAQHASSAERLPLLETFYERIFGVTGRPTSIADVAAGMSPLALPWLKLEPGTSYTALDIDAELVAFADRALDLLGLPHEVRVLDVLCDEPPAADLALLLKTVPCLEKQERGAGFDLVGRLDARAVVASFATASLGGRPKGMARTHAEAFEREGRTRGWRWERIDFPGELVYVVWR
jgi:16S rRNA (guanine(1405)-N(7))-methyltransferase